MRHSVPLLLALLLADCASKQRFGYPIASAAAGSATGRTVEVLPISDTRTNRNIDAHFTTNLLEDVRGVVAFELAGTGLFKLETMPAPNPALSEPVNAPSDTQSKASRGERGANQSSPRSGDTQDPAGKMPPSTAGGTPAATGEKGGPAELRLKTELQRLQWEVPHYDA